MDRVSPLIFADAARAAEWPLRYTGHLVNHGLDAYQIEEYLFYDNGSFLAQVGLT